MLAGSVDEHRHTSSAKVCGMNTSRLVIALLIGCVCTLALAQAPAGRWSEAKANEWYLKQPWLVGSNYIPANAINELEMWQADTFDPNTIDKELGWAEGLGMNSMRVFLHHLLWEQDKEGFLKRMDQFLEVADKHKIRIMFVLFDSVWDPNPSWASSASRRRDCTTPAGCRAPAPMT